MKIGAREWFVGVLMVGLLASCGGRAGDLSVDLGRGVKMDFVLIKAGSFMMGSEKGNANEKPVHKVTITKPFYIGVYEVTQAQWKALMGDNPSLQKGDDLPVENVSWEDCQGFLAKLKEKAGKGMMCRFPTEAEWEYACRAGAKTEYSFGDDVGSLEDYAWFGANSQNENHPVGQKKPNAWGLYDMHGNVSEWCSDWFDAAYYAKSPPEDPKGPASGEFRIARGGSWRDDAGSTRSASRYWLVPSRTFSDSDRVGCRVVMSAQE